MQSTYVWAREEFGEAELGDQRRTRRLVAMAGEVAATPAGTVTRACGSSASREGAFRLLENRAVGPEAVRRCVHSATARRCKEHNFVFVAVDGTSLHVTDRKGTKGVGSIGAVYKGARGIQVMTALAVASDGSPLGTAAQKMWVRQQRSRRSPTGLPQYGGENAHWREVIDECQRAFSKECPSTTPWYQLDRGGDCWQVLTYATSANLRLTVRAAHDRRLDDDAGRLWNRLEKSPTVATKWLDVRARGPQRRKRWVGSTRIKELTPPREARRAKVEIRATSVALLVPTPEGRVAVAFNAVLVREIKRKKDRVEWLLLTTAATATRAQVLEVVRGYAHRWRVEDFHRAWKRGLCRVEDTQLRSRDAICKWATLLAAVATRAMRLTHQARATPDAPAGSELTAIELEALVALRQPKNRDNREPTLAEAVRWLAQIGGYTGPWNGPPGPTTVGRGLHDVLIAARAFAHRDKKR